MRQMTVRCDGCGVVQETRRAEDEAMLKARGQLRAEQTITRPLTWYHVEDVSLVRRTGLIDLCSMACLIAWATDPQVAEALPDDLGLIDKATA